MNEWDWTRDWLPYAGDQQSGHQGEASQDAEPSRRHRIEQAYRIVLAEGYRGITWYELAERLGIHHGSASGALSNLHRLGKIARLKERRGGSGIYVALSHIEGRRTVPHRSRKSLDRMALVAQVDGLRETYDSETIDAVLDIIEGA